MTKKIWQILLALWLVLWGLLSISNFQIQQAPFLLGLLAIVTGIFVILDR